MATTYIPVKDQDLRAWAVNFSTLITATPTAYGLAVADATAISNAVNAFTAALLTSSNPNTRTSATVAAKDNAKNFMLQVVRPYAQRINLNAGVTDAQRAALGITIRKTVPTPVPPPTSAPALTFGAAVHGQVTLGYKDPSLPSGKAKPYGVIRVDVFLATGVVPAIDPSQAVFTTSVTKSPFVLPVPQSSVGKVITAYARYATRSGPGGIAQFGPFSPALVFTGL